jgi:eukaryotic-like serine/threonine-protein kinase
VGDAGSYNQIRLSPDGTRVLLMLLDFKFSTTVVSVLDLGSGVASRMTPNGETANDAVWLPDSETVAFESRPKGRRDFYSQTVGSRNSTLIFESTDDPKWLDDLSADGRYILFHVPSPGKLFAVPTFGDRQPLPLIATTAAIDGAHFSSDGKWVVYQSQESGIFQVWVASFPAFDHRRQISTQQGGGQAWWRADGKEVFYLRPDGKLMSVTVASQAANGALVFHPPVELFQSPISSPNLTLDQYNVARDGQRFLFLQPRQDQAVAGVPMTVVVNWPSTLSK